MAGISGNNLRGNLNQRLPIGPGNMMRSMSARSINTYSSGQEQLNRLSHNGIAQSSIQPSHVMMRGTSQRSLGNSSALLDTSVQRQGLMRGASHGSLGNALPSTSVYSQRPGLIRGTSQMSLGNNDALLNTSLNFQQTGVMMRAPQRSIRKNDALLNTSIHSQKSGLIRGASQRSLGNNNSLLNNKVIHSQRPGLMRGASQRSLGNSNALHVSSTRSNPNMRMNTAQQSYIGTKNAQWTVNNTNPPSVTGDSIFVVSHISGDTSVISLKSRRNESPRSLADQI